MLFFYAFLRLFHTQWQNLSLVKTVLNCLFNVNLFLINPSMFDPGVQVSHTVTAVMPCEICRVTGALVVGCKKVYFNQAFYHIFHFPGFIECLLMLNHRQHSSIHILPVDQAEGYEGTKPWRTNQLFNLRIPRVMMTACHHFPNLPSLFFGR